MRLDMDKSSNLKSRHSHCHLLIWTSRPHHLFFSDGSQGFWGLLVSVMVGAIKESATLICGKHSMVGRTWVLKSLFPLESWQRVKFHWPCIRRASWQSVRAFLSHLFSPEPPHSGHFGASTSDCFIRWAQKMNWSIHSLFPFLRGTSAIQASSLVHLTREILVGPSLPAPSLKMPAKRLKDHRDRVLLWTSEEAIYALR